MNSPHPISTKVWNEIARLPSVRDEFGLRVLPRKERGRVLAKSAYGARFGFESGTEGRITELYVVVADAWGLSPILLVRGERGALSAVE